MSSRWMSSGSPGSALQRYACHHLLSLAPNSVMASASGSCIERVTVEAVMLYATAVTRLRSAAKWETARGGRSLRWANGSTARTSGRGVCVPASSRADRAEVVTETATRLRRSCHCHPRRKFKLPNSGVHLVVCAVGEYTNHRTKWHIHTET
ncbi:hypothetical protein BD413DRAFT_36862 [Trametes elegans]|nr:hypothetical protein BD413DRAFT_36862 [Trametes elegans]